MMHARSINNFKSNGMDVSEWSEVHGLCRVCQEHIKPPLIDFPITFGEWLRSKLSIRGLDFAPTELNQLNFNSIKAASHKHGPTEAPIDHNADMWGQRAKWKHFNFQTDPLYTLLNCLQEEYVNKNHKVSFKEIYTTYVEEDQFIYTWNTPLTLPSPLPYVRTHINTLKSICLSPWRRHHCADAAVFWDEHNGMNWQRAIVGLNGLKASVCSNKELQILSNSVWNPLSRHLSDVGIGGPTFWNRIFDRRYNIGRQESLDFSWVAWCKAQSNTFDTRPKQPIKKLIQPYNQNITMIWCLGCFRSRWSSLDFFVKRPALTWRLFKHLLTFDFCFISSSSNIAAVIAIHIMLGYLVLSLSTPA